MPSITDKFGGTFNTVNPVTTTVTVARSAGGTTLTCDSLVGWPTGFPVHFTTYKKNASNVVIAGTQIDWKGIVSGSTIGSLTRKAGATDTGNAVGDIVEAMPTGSWAQDLIDGVSTSLDVDGTLKAGAVDNAAVLASNVVTTAKLADDAVTPAKLLAGTGTSWPWQSWTPTWTNLTVGNAVQTCKYIQIGKTVHFRVSLILGSTSSVGTAPAFTLPVPAVTMTINTMLGVSTYIDSTTGVVQGFVCWNSTTTALPVPSTTSYFGGLSASNPFVWSGPNGDAILCTGTYEAA